ncbi:MAG: PepSY domain-containing protein [Muribaculaceae bacterium]|nr:PepSY domain-containing protein [Muribaculaceae bacterium]
MKWHKQHKWFGIIGAVILIALSISGIILNHRNMAADYDVSRRWLPSRYTFRNWNGGLLRGTVTYGGDSVLIYGSNGIWITDSLPQDAKDFNYGLPDAADYRQVKIVICRGGSYYAVTPSGVYRLSAGRWIDMDIPIADDDRFSDAEVKGDTLAILSRSAVYVSAGSGAPFDRAELKAPDNFNTDVTLFRTVWALHSGELFGLTGKLIVDLIAVCFIVLSISGLICWLIPKYIKRHKVDKCGVNTFKSTLWLHNKVGLWSIVLTLLVAVTGWCLRPPVMIPLVLTKTPAVPGSSLDSDNPWHDRLRMIGYDSEHNDWILSTSDGFYALHDFDEKPIRLDNTPPVSVMGLNVMLQDNDGRWLCGSFTGMYLWDRAGEVSYDYFTGDTAQSQSGPPFGKFAVSGYSEHFSSVVEYNQGDSTLVQPEWMSYLPMSLWNVALEIHSGRFFIGNIATYIFIFVAGIAVVWCLISGWKIRKRRRQ